MSLSNDLIYDILYRNSNNICANMPRIFTSINEFQANEFHRKDNEFTSWPILNDSFNVLFQIIEKAS